MRRIYANSDWRNRKHFFMYEIVKYLKYKEMIGIKLDIQFQNVKANLY